MASDAQPPRPPVLVLCQLVGLEALRARVPAALRRTVDQLNRLLDRLAAEHGGHRVRSPAIGVLTRWPDARTAVDFAIHLQRASLVEEWPTTLLLRPEASEWRSPDGTLLHRGPRIRCAVHVGSPGGHLGSAETEVIAGPALYQAARILSTLHGGQVVLSHHAWEALGELPEGVVARDLGEHTLIGVHGTSRFHEIAPAELARRSFPAPRTREVARTNAPALRPGFVGRDGDLQAIAELVGFGIRVVTLTGPPGVGKSGMLSRFVAMHAGPYLEGSGGGAWLCRAEGPTASHVVSAVAGAFGLSLRFGRTEEALIRQVGALLSSRGPTLLAIDGVVAPPAAMAEALGHWLKSAPELKVLVATSDRLGVPGEVTYRLAPLPAVAFENARNDPAVRLFVDRAQLRTPRFQPSDPGAVAALVNALGGSPLAIEWIAGLTARLSVEELLAEVHAREPGLEAALDLVWSTIDEEERHVLCSCSVFASAFDQLGAEAVVDIRETGIDAMAVLRRLQRSGLVTRTDDPRTPEVRRFRVDRRVRARAAQALRPEQLQQLRRRAALQILGQCERWAADAWGPQGTEALARLGIEWVNIAAIARAAAREDAEPVDVDLGLRAITLLWPLVACAGPTGLYVELASVVLDRAESMLASDPVFQARAFAARAGARRNFGDLAGALSDAERGGEVARRWGDPEGLGLSLLHAGLVHHARSRLDRASEVVERAIEALRAELPGQAAVARGVLGVVRMDQGRNSEADALVRESMAELERLGWHRHIGLQITTMAMLSRRAGELDEARELYARAAVLHSRVGDRRALAISLVNQASLELREARFEHARATLEQALAASRETGDRISESRVHGNLALAALAQGEIQLARDHLLGALAIDRDLRDKVGEAMDTAYLAVANHLQDQPDQALKGFESALKVLDDRAPTRERAPIRAWLALALAECGDLEQARAELSKAQALADQTAEPETLLVVETLGLAVALVAEPTADQLARAEAIVGRTARELDIDSVIARQRVVRLLERVSAG